MPMYFCKHAVFDTDIADEDFIQRVIFKTVICVRADLRQKHR